MLGQSPSPRHWTQVLVLVEQKGVAPEQSEFARHCTQAPVVAKQYGKDPGYFELQNEELGQPSQLFVDEEQEGLAGLVQSVLVEHSTQLFERQIGLLEGQSDAVPHSTQVPP